ncbi:MAG TPA: hypothetical protein DCW68_06980 [Rhodospirillaceae bacterium]|nr:hypothetical protein [Rhodospirillaceae bacterium]
MSNEIAGVNGDRLKSIIERIERLEQEKGGITSDIRDIYAEAKGVGYDTKIIRQVIKVRKMEQAERMEQEELVQVYMHALGMTA